MTLLRNFASLLMLCLVLQVSFAQTNTKPWIVEVDSDREFLTAVMRSTVWNELLAPLSIPYADEAAAMMETERDGELSGAFSGLTSLNSRGLYIHEVIYNSDAIVNGKALPQTLAERAGGSEKLTSLSSALKSLREKVKWDAFWVSHAFQRDGVISPFHEVAFQKAAADLLHSLASDGIQVRVSIAMQSGLVLPAVWSDDHKSLTISVPSLFANGDSLSSGRVLQEAAKAIIGSALEKHSTRVDRHAGWFSLVKSKLTMEGLSDWKAAVASSFAGVIAQRSLVRAGANKEADAFVKSQEIRGFGWQNFLILPATESTVDADISKLLDQMDRIEPNFSGGEAPDPGLRDVWLTDEGLPVKKLTSGSAAAKAGIRVGDIVAAIGGVKINGSESFLKAWKKWDTAEHGSKVPFLVKRGKAFFTAQVLLEKTGAFKGFRRKSGATP